MKIKDINSCKVVSKLISKSFEEKLSLKETIILKVHLMMCITCVYLHNQVKLLRDILHHYPDKIREVEPNNEKCLSEEAKQRLKKKLQDIKYGE